VNPLRRSLLLTLLFPRQELRDNTKAILSTANSVAQKKEFRKQVYTRRSAPRARTDLRPLPRMMPRVVGPQRSSH